MLILFIDLNLKPILRLVFTWGVFLFIKTQHFSCKHHSVNIQSAVSTGYIFLNNTVWKIEEKKIGLIISHLTWGSWTISTTTETTRKRVSKNRASLKLQEYQIDGIQPNNTSLYQFEKWRAPRGCQKFQVLRVLDCEFRKRFWSTQVSGMEHLQISVTSWRRCGAQHYPAKPKLDSSKPLSKAYYCTAVKHRPSLGKWKRGSTVVIQTCCVWSWVLVGTKSLQTSNCTKNSPESQVKSLREDWNLQGIAFDTQNWVHQISFSGNRKGELQALENLPTPMWTTCTETLEWKRYQKSRRHCTTECSGGRSQERFEWELE